MYHKKHIGKNRIRIELFYTFITNLHTFAIGLYNSTYIPLHTVTNTLNTYESYIYILNITTNRNRLYTKDILYNIDIKLRKSIIITNLIFEETNLNKHSKDINLNNNII